MNKAWPISILTIAITLLAILKTHELQSLAPFFKSERVIKLKEFEAARKRVSPKDLELLKLWESMLTGRSAPLSRFMKERYQKLGLNHLFTPSGFHLSAVLFPFIKFFKNSNQRLGLLFLLACGLCFLPGMSALKRMLSIKIHQNIFGLHVGFILAMMMDIFFGTFQNSALSFTYSFLFLGIIYSGFQGILLVIWFFIGQMILAYFQGTDISLLLLFFSPFLNFAFALLMPLLFLLSFPLWNWQLGLGIFLLKQLQFLVDQLAIIIQKTPMIEIHSITLIVIAFILLRHWKSVLLFSFIFSSSLNLDRQKNPGPGTNEFVPQGQLIKTVYDEKNTKVYFTDGSCKLKLVRGFWWENCSPRRKRSG